MGEPGFPTRLEKQEMALVAAKAYDAVNEDLDGEEYQLPDRDMLIKILIQYARMIGLR